MENPSVAPCPPTSKLRPTLPGLGDGETTGDGNAKRNVGTGEVETRPLPSFDAAWDLGRNNWDQPLDTNTDDEAVVLKTATMQGGQLQEASSSHLVDAQVQYAIRNGIYHLSMLRYLYCWKFSVWDVVRHVAVGVSVSLDN